MKRNQRKKSRGLKLLSLTKYIKLLKIHNKLRVKMYRSEAMESSLMGYLSMPGLVVSEDPGPDPAFSVFRWENLRSVEFSSRL